METRVITIARQVGTQGEEVARQVADELGFLLLDYRVVQAAAEEAGVSTETIAESEHKPSFFTRILEALARNATAVMTNVPGPQLPLYFGGARIESQLVWVPQSGNIGMGVSILSYNGQVQFGVVTDRGLCPDPQRISARFGPEFEHLRTLVPGAPTTSARRA